jgi:hypothetical protein
MIADHDQEQANDGQSKAKQAATDSGFPEANEAEHDAHGRDWNTSKDQ